MKKLLSIGISLAILASGIGGGYYYFQNKEVLKPVHESYKYLDKEKANDKVLDLKHIEKGKLVYEGGPYKLGDLVYVKGIGVKIEPVGTSNEVLRKQSKTKMEFGVFQLTLYNYTMYPYELKAEDVIFEYKDEDGQLYRQPINVSGYDSWKYINGSYQFTEVAGKMKRTGKIFVPIKETAKKNGQFTIYIHKVPLTFYY